MKKGLSMLLAMTMVFALVTYSSASGSSSQQVVLIAAHADSPKSIFQYGLEQFKTKLEELSGGTMSATIYPSGQLGTLKETLEAVRGGTVDIAPIGYSVLASYAKDMGVLDLPFLWDGYQHVNTAFDGELGAYFAQELSNYQLDVVGWYSQGFREVTSNTEIKSLADMKGMKIRVMSSDVYTKTFTALGSSPMSVDFSELFTALQQRTVDAQENPPLTIKDNGFAEVQKYLVMTNHTFYGAGLVFSPTTMEKLTEEQRNWVREAAAFSAAAEQIECEKWNNEAVTALTASGMVVLEVDNKELRDAVAGVYDSYPQYAELRAMIDKSR